MNKAIIISAKLKPGFANLSTAVKGIQVDVTLPAGVTPTHTNGQLLISETGLKNLNSNGFIASGSYDTTTGVHFTLLPNNVVSSDLGVGDIARLTYQTANGVELSAQDIQPVFKVSGAGSRPLYGLDPSVSIITYLKP